MRETDAMTLLEDVAAKKKGLLQEAAGIVTKYATTSGDNPDLVIKNIGKMTKSFTTEERAVIFQIAIGMMCQKAGNQQRSNSGGSFVGGSRKRSDMFGL